MLRAPPPPARTTPADVRAARLLGTYVRRVQFPARAIMMAVFMFLLGSLLITIGALLMVGIIGSATEVRRRACWACALLRACGA